MSYPTCKKTEVAVNNHVGDQIIWLPNSSKNMPCPWLSCRQASNTPTATSVILKFQRPETFAPKIHDNCCVIFLISKKYAASSSYRKWWSNMFETTRNYHHFFPPTSRALPSQHSLCIALTTWVLCSWAMVSTGKGWTSGWNIMYCQTGCILSCLQMLFHTGVIQVFCFDNLVKKNIWADWTTVLLGCSLISLVHESMTVY